MEITIRGGKQTIDPPMHSNKKMMKKDSDKVVDADGEVEDNTVKYTEVLKKVTPMPLPPPPFPQRLLKKIKDGKYWRFITMLKQISINVP